jgi:hypothetical protein
MFTVSSRRSQPQPPASRIGRFRAPFKASVTESWTPWLTVPSFGSGDDQAARFAHIPRRRRDRRSSRGASTPVINALSRRGVVYDDRRSSLGCALVEPFDRRGFVDAGPHFFGVREIRIHPARTPPKFRPDGTCPHPTNPVDSRPRRHRTAHFHTSAGSITCR